MKLNKLEDKDLLEDGVIPEVRIYQHVSIPMGADGDVESIDLKLYETSEIKDVNIKRVERIVQEAAIDCSLNYKRNYKEGYDMQRECNYENCNYKCDGVRTLEIDENDLDISTYNLYYNTENVNKITTKILELFKENFILSLKNILRTLNLDSNYSSYSDFDILTALNNIINNHILIKNKSVVTSRNFF